MQTNKLNRGGYYLWESPSDPSEICVLWIHLLNNKKEMTYVLKYDNPGNIQRTKMFNYQIKKSIKTKKFMVIEVNSCPFTDYLRKISKAEIALLIVLNKLEKV